MAKTKKKTMDVSGQFQHLGGCLELSADFVTRKIWVFGGIDDETAYKFTIALQTMDLTEGEITVFVFSGGGSEPAGYVMFDAIRMTQNPVTMVGMGAVMSITAMIIQAADLRLLTPTCRFMIHNGSISLAPDLHADTCVAIGKEIQRNNRRYHQILADRTGIPVQKIRRYCEVETYWSAEEAVRLNFADGVVVVREPGKSEVSIETGLEDPDAPKKKKGKEKKA